MRYIAAIISLLFLMLVLAVIGLSSDEPTASDPPLASSSTASKETERVYPIAPGVWYPGQPLPEKPMRYYRIRCWPGCHSGSDYGKYPEKPLTMKPIYPTSALRTH